MIFFFLCVCVIYHHVLIKQQPQDNLTMLDQAMDLLSAPKVSESVVSMVMDMVENLLTLKEEEEEEAKNDGISSVSLDHLESGPQACKNNLYFVKA